jgi:hypothetical protein
MINQKAFKIPLPVIPLCLVLDRYFGIPAPEIVTISAIVIYIWGYWGFKHLIANSGV